MLLTLCLSCSLWLPLNGVANNLPGLGEPSDNALSPNQEVALGRELMRQLRHTLPMIPDLQINEYLRDLGAALGTYARSDYLRNYRFYLVDDSQINAFALPGGHICTYAGLVLAMEQEQQLASVLAHELAHLTQRHHARAFASSSKTRLSTAAAVIAALVIGASNPEAGQAALAAGLAISQQNAINYTRSHEYEADRIGIGILADAGFNPDAMPRTFDVMQQRNSLNRSGTDFEYLRTHPLDSNRIAEARTRARQLGRDRRNPRPDRELDFQLFRTRLEILTTNGDNTLQARYQTRFDRSNNDNVARYALALLADRTGQYRRSHELLEPLREKAPENLMVQLLAASARTELGRYQESEDILRQSMETHPSSYAAVSMLSELFSRQSHLRKAADLIRRYQRQIDDPEPASWRELANLQQKMSDDAGSHESLAQYFIALDETRRAIEQVELAVPMVPAGSQQELRLRALLKSLEAG